MNDAEVLKCSIFLTVSGSKAYGTATAESDTDLRGVCLPRDKAEYLGVRQKAFEQKDAWGDGADRVVYDFRKALKLMAAGNPNMIDLAFTPERFWVLCAPVWQEVIDNRQMFLSKKMRFTYGGYAYSQLKRIRNHRSYLLNPPKKRPERSDFGLSEGSRNLSADQSSSFQHLICLLLHRKIHLLPFSETTKAELEAIDFTKFIGSADLEQYAQTLSQLTGASDQFVYNFMRERQYAHAMHEWIAYKTWQTERNPKRQQMEDLVGYDCKHAMHLVRLLRMAVEIMSTAQVNVHRAHDREELQAIRQGQWPYEKVESFAIETETHLNSLYKTSTLPESADINAIERLCINSIEKSVFSR